MEMGQQYYQGQVTLQCVRQATGSDQVLATLQGICTHSIQ